MKFLRLMLCLSTGITPSFITSGQQVFPLENLPSKPVTISNLEWEYRSPGAPASARISVTNNGSRAIMSVSLMVVAKDQKGTMLQSHGTTIKRLVNRDTIGAGETKPLYFKSAFDNPNIATLELNGGFVEYVNGAIEKIHN